MIQMGAIRLYVNLKTASLNSPRINFFAIFNHWLTNLSSSTNLERGNTIKYSKFNDKIARNSQLEIHEEFFF